MKKLPVFILSFLITSHVIGMQKFSISKNLASSKFSRMYGSLAFATYHPISQKANTKRSCPWVAMPTLSGVLVECLGCEYQENFKKISLQDKPCKKSTCNWNVIVIEDSSKHAPNLSGPALLTQCSSCKKTELIVRSE